jgi:hypothetical protein
LEVLLLLALDKLGGIEYYCQHSMKLGVLLPLVLDELGNIEYSSRRSSVAAADT